MLPAFRRSDPSNAGGDPCWSRSASVTRWTKCRMSSVKALMWRYAQAGDRNHRSPVCCSIVFRDDAGTIQSLLAYDLAKRREQRGRSPRGCCSGPRRCAAPRPLPSRPSRSMSVEGVVVAVPAEDAALGQRLGELARRVARRWSAMTVGTRRGRSARRCEAVDVDARQRLAGRRADAPPGRARTPGWPPWPRAAPGGARHAGESARAVSSICGRPRSAR